MAANNATLFHRIRFVAPDAAVIIDFADGTSVFIVRDIEMDRARKGVRADEVCCAADFEPQGGLSGDRDTALAQATAECLRRAGETSVTVDRTLPYLYAHFILQAGIEIEYSEDLGVLERRTKDPGEIEHLRHAQKITGEAMTFACRTIANAKPDAERDSPSRRRRADLRTGPVHDHGVPGRTEFLQRARFDRGDGSPRRRLPSFRRGTAEGGSAGDRRYLSDGQRDALPWRHDAHRRLRRAVGGSCSRCTPPCARRRQPVAPRSSRERPARRSILPRLR